MGTLEDRSTEGLFGYGRDGLPGEIDIWLSQPGAVDDLALEIIMRWLQWAEEHEVKGRRRVADSQLTELNTLASILIRYHVRHNMPPTAMIAHALDHVLGLISARTGNPLPDRAVLARFGIPQVDRMKEFLDAAQLDGEADATGKPLSMRELAKLVRVSRATIERWRHDAAYARRRRFVRTFSSIPTPALQT